MVIRILLVDDNAKVREVIERTLKDKGYEVRSVAHATAALDTHDFVPDLLVTDFGLPDITGVELARQLQAKHNALLVLLISGHPLEEFYDEALPLTHAYLEKPFSAADLLLAVRRLTGRPAPADATTDAPGPRTDRAEDEWMRITGTRRIEG